MPMITTRDGTTILYKDWGPKTAQPVVFHHGWPLSADNWDGQMLFFLSCGYRVIAHDRRGHGRSYQTDTGNDIDTYVTDVTDLVQALDLRDAIHIGHSTGSGEVARYVAGAEAGRVAKAVLIGTVAPVMVQSATNPDGIPLAAFDGVRAAVAANRAQFFLDLASGPFYGFNRPGAVINEGLVRNFFRQAMAGGIKAQYDCIAVYSETDFTADLRAITVPTLLMHGEDDQAVPIDTSARKAVGLLRNGTLKTYPGLSHGLFATHPEVINADLLAFVRG
ncbi:alpha/beta hydrolase [Frigidibacter sp. RF13]|uniref:alpha/beta fold hydrolase n=1 Tax=Frigidibacter sp. RF13 TaxID=2997340 RepID=UPI002270B32F|nr:alpha/beta hydrolase [Frigidibacter sp. RF13]MCY1127570.1 alpha/beta hydrolase [Frigidibacter sp. RF13]